MAAIREMLRQARADGFLDENAEAKVCQDIVLKALSENAENPCQLQKSTGRRKV